MSTIDVEQLERVRGGWLPRTDDDACRRDMTEAGNDGAGLGIYAGGAAGGLTGAIAFGNARWISRPIAATIVGLGAGAVAGFQLLQYGAAALEKRFATSCRMRG